MTVTDERPVTKTQLPFKLSSNGRGNTVSVEWTDTFDTNAGKKTLPMFIEVDAGPQAHLGNRIRQLMDMYWDLEAKQGAVLKERDEAVERAQKADQQVERLKKELEGLRRQQKGEK